MDKKLQNKIFKRFDYMFRERKLPMSQTCMCWGITTGNGWYDLLWKLCEDIEKELKKDIEVKKEFAFTQVKEKFATLRAYYNGGTEKIETLICKAEQKSAVTCEICGKPGKQCGGAWVKTLCKKCNTE